MFSDRRVESGEGVGCELEVVEGERISAGKFLAGVPQVHAEGGRIVRPCFDDRLDWLKLGLVDCSVETLPRRSTKEIIVINGLSEGRKGSIVDSSRIKTQTIYVSKSIWDLYDENTVEE